MKRCYLVSTFVSSAAGIFAISTAVPVAAADLNPVYKGSGASDRIRVQLG
jgi:hypothetical protein